MAKNPTKLFVGNLNFKSTEGGFLEFVGELGITATKFSIVTDRDTGRSRGFGFLELPGDADVQRAVEELNNREFDGRALTVNEARPKESRR